MTFKDYIEQSLDPASSDYAGQKFEHFLKETKNAECPGCGQAGLYEYNIIDPVQGFLACPRCPQQIDLKTMMKSWITQDEKRYESLNIKWPN